MTTDVFILKYDFFKIKSILVKYIFWLKVWIWTSIHLYAKSFIQTRIIWMIFFGGTSLWMLVRALHGLANNFIQHRKNINKWCSISHLESDRPTDRLIIIINYLFLPEHRNKNLPAHVPTPTRFPHSSYSLVALKSDLALLPYMNHDTDNRFQRIQSHWLFIDHRFWFSFFERLSKIY